MFMRPHGSSAELERRRRLAVKRARSGYTQQEVADFLGVHVRSVQRWVRAYREYGRAGLKAKPASGRPPKLSSLQERRVLSWFRRSPREFGFPNELWTGARVAELIQRKFHKKFHPHYINQWLAQRRITSQKPAKQARERNAREVRRWLREEWPRIKKVLGVGVRTWS
jgi:transposase